MPILYRRLPKLGAQQNLSQPLKAQNFTIPDGIGGNLKTVEVMKSVARQCCALPFVRQTAINILNDAHTFSHDYQAEALAIGQFVKDNVRYVKDAEGIEQITSPVTLLEQITRGVAREDCDGMSLLIATLLLSIGHTPCFRAIKYKLNAPYYAHIYVVDYVDDTRIALDAILDGKPMGYEIPHAAGDEYPV